MGLAKTSLGTFDRLLNAMLTKAPKPLGKTAAKLRSSSEGASADYSGTQTRAGKSANASLKPKRKSRKSTASSATRKPR